MRIAIAFLLLPFFADAQIVRAWPFYTAPDEVAAYVYPLDTVTGGYVGYSLRKLDSNYTGSAIRVRRKSDNTEQDIGFVNNHLDTAALKTFAGTGATDTAWIVTWYNQADSSGVFGVRNQVQATAANQPRIVTSGFVNRENGNPCVIFDGLNDFLGANNAASNWKFFHDGTKNTNFITGRFGSVADPEEFYCIIGTTLTVVPPGGAYLAHDTRSSIQRDDAIVNIGWTNNVAIINAQSANSTLANQQVLVYHFADYSSATAAEKSAIATNGAAIQKNNTSTSSPETGNPRHPLQIGSAMNFSNVNIAFLNGAMQEIIIYNSDKSANRTLLESNINAFYSIY